MNIFSARLQFADDPDTDFQGEGARVRVDEDAAAACSRDPAAGTKMSGSRRENFLPLLFSSVK